jgi:hypothetical protein
MSCGLEGDELTELPATAEQDKRAEGLLNLDEKQ